MRIVAYWLPLLLLAPAVARAADPPAKTEPYSKAEIAEDEKTLKEAKLGTDGTALLEFFRKRTGTEADRERVAAFVKQLGDDDFAVRDAAAKRILAVGLPAAAQLHHAVLNSRDEEVRDAAAICLARLEENSSPALASAAARLLRVRHPAGTPSVLLAYSPFAQDATVEEEVLAALATLGVHDEKVDAVLLAALKDKSPGRRAAAALVVGRSGTAEEKKQVHALLTDPEQTVRLRAAQGLLAGRDKAGIGTLIALLSEAPLDTARQVEDQLGCLAGGTAPAGALGETAASRRRCRELWEAWWKVREKAYDLSRAECDLPPFNATLQIRQVTREFFNALNASDAAALARTTQAPFTYNTNQTFATREEAMGFLFNVMVNLRSQNQMVFPQRVATLDEYARIAPQHEKDFLKRLPPAEVRVVFVTATQNGQPISQCNFFNAVFLHIKNNRVHVFATGQGMWNARPPR